MSEHKPTGGRLLTLPVIVLGIFSGIALFILAQRFMFGLGAVTNLNNGYPWGIWVVYDIVIGTAFACGGYVLAFTVYVMNRGKYHPLVRPALLASLFGYTLGGLSAIFDMGRYWNAPNMFMPWHQNFNSVMLEVGLCVSAYIIVLFIEFAPAAFERFGMRDAKARLEKVLYVIIALGIVLPTMHQSSLGSLLIALGGKIDPLWQSLHLMPAFALLSAITMGFSIVVFEASLATLGFKRPSETPLLTGLGRAIQWLLIAWLVLRVADLLFRGHLGLAFAGDLRGNMFLLETLLFVVPLVILSSKRNRTNGNLLLIAAVSMLFAGALYRVNAFLVAYNPSPGYTYFPSTSELLVSVGLVAFEILAYIVIVKTLPVLHSPKHA